MANPKKVELIADLKERLERKPNFILTSYSGLTVHEMEVFRGKVRNAESEVKVIKNNLFLRALKESDNHKDTTIEFGDNYYGPLAAIFSGDNLPELAKVCKEFSKDKEKLQVKFGYFDGQILDEKGVKDIAGLPSKEDLLSIIGRGLNTPAQKIAVGMNEVISKLARGIKSVGEKNGN